MRSILNYINILENEGIGQEDEKNINILLNKLLIRINSKGLKSLNCDELYFMILCFDDKLDTFLNIVGGNDDMTVTRDSDLSKDWVKFDEAFVNRCVNIINRAVGSYHIEDSDQLIVCLKDIMHIYKEAKQWMTKRGYSI